MLSYGVDIELLSSTAVEAQNPQPISFQASGAAGSCFLPEVSAFGTVLRGVTVANNTDKRPMKSALVVCSNESDIRKGYSEETEYEHKVFDEMPTKGFSGKWEECNRKVDLKLHEEFLRLEKKFEALGLGVSVPDVTIGIDDEEHGSHLIPHESEEGFDGESTCFEAGEVKADESWIECVEGGEENDSSNFSSYTDINMSNDSDAAAGLQVDDDGKPKVINVSNCIESEDFVTSTMKKNCCTLEPCPEGVDIAYNLGVDLDKSIPLLQKIVITKEEQLTLEAVDDLLKWHCDSSKSDVVNGDICRTRVSTNSDCDIPDNVEYLAEKNCSTQEIHVYTKEGDKTYPKPQEETDLEKEQMKDEKADLILNKIDDRSSQIVNLMEKDLDNVRKSLEITEKEFLNAYEEGEEIPTVIVLMPLGKSALFCRVYLSYWKQHTSLSPLALEAWLADDLDNKATSVGERMALICDPGGSTLDISFLTIAEDIFKVEATAKITHLGGDDFDNGRDYCCPHKLWGKEKDIGGILGARRRLGILCKKANQTLSSTAQTITEFKESVEKCSRDTNIDSSTAYGIVVASGSTRIPNIRQIHQDSFKGEETCKSNNLKGVSCGAVVAASIRIGGGYEKCLDSLDKGLNINDGEKFTKILLQDLSKYPAHLKEEKNNAPAKFLGNKNENAITSMRQVTCTDTIKGEGAATFKGFIRQGVCLRGLAVMLVGSDVSSLVNCVAYAAEASDKNVLARVLLTSDRDYVKTLKYVDSLSWKFLGVVDPVLLSLMGIRDLCYPIDQYKCVLRHTAAPSEEKWILEDNRKILFEWFPSLNIWAWEFASIVSDRLDIHALLLTGPKCVPTKNATREKQGSATMKDVDILWQGEVKKVAKSLALKWQNLTSRSSGPDCCHKHQLLLVYLGIEGRGRFAILFHDFKVETTVDVIGTSLKGNEVTESKSTYLFAYVKGKGTHFRLSELFPDGFLSGSLAVSDQMKEFPFKQIEETFFNVFEPCTFTDCDSKWLSLFISLLKLACLYFCELDCSFGTNIAWKEGDKPETLSAKLIAYTKGNGINDEDDEAIFKAFEVSVTSDNIGEVYLHFDPIKTRHGATEAVEGTKIVEELRTLVNDDSLLFPFDPGGILTLEDKGVLKGKGMLREWVALS